MSHTGYVHQMLNGKQDFQAFVWTCARAFGALVLMRDEPMDAPIPLSFEPSSYYTKSLAEKTAARDEWDAMEHAARIAWAEADKARQIASYQDSIAEADDEAARIRAMREQVEAWTPPTMEHAGLKRFMLEQLAQSFTYGEPGKYYRESLESLEATSVEDLVAAHSAKVVEDVAWAEKSLAEEVARVNERNAWLAALNESVPLRNSKGETA